MQPGSYRHLQPHIHNCPLIWTEHRFYKPYGRNPAAALVRADSEPPPPPPRCPAPPSDRAASAAASSLEGIFKQPPPSLALCPNAGPRLSGGCGLAPAPTPSMRCTLATYAASPGRAATEGSTDTRVLSGARLLRRGEPCWRLARGCRRGRSGTADGGGGCGAWWVSSTAPEEEGLGGGGAVVAAATPVMVPPPASAVLPGQTVDVAPPVRGREGPWCAWCASGSVPGGASRSGAPGEDAAARVALAAALRCVAGGWAHSRAALTFLLGDAWRLAAATSWLLVLPAPVVVAEVMLVLPTPAPALNRTPAPVA